VTQAVSLRACTAETLISRPGQFLWYF